MRKAPRHILGAALLLTCAGQLRALPPPFVCDANAGVPPLVRADGKTELVADAILNCTGGIPTLAGVSVPLSNVQIFLNTNVTSRIVGSNSLSEATLMIDEPLPPVAARIPDSSVFVPFVPPPPQVLCIPQGNPCPIVGDGFGTPYKTIPGTPTVYSGRQLSVNSVTWNGVPIDAPGNAITRVIRITNVRANACQLGTSSSLIPTQIVMSILITGSQQLTINNSPQTVAFVLPSLIVGGTTGTGLQCVSQNTPLTSPNFNITVKEGFASSFKRRNVALTTDTVTPPAPLAQNIPGWPYNTESGFYNPALFTATPRVGLADYGTRIRITFNGIGAGVNLFVPVSVPLVIPGTSTATTPEQPPSPVPPGITQGRMVLIQTDQYGVDLSPGPGYSAVTVAAGTSGGVPVAAIALSTTPGQGYAVYEVVNSDVNVTEMATIPVSVAFASNAGFGEITANVSLAPAGGPLASIETGDLNAPIPRFCDNSVPMNAFLIGACQEIGALDLAGNANGIGAVVKGNTLYAIGWAADTATGAPVQSVTVFVDGNSVGTATLGTARSDVASYYGRSDFTNSGWSFQMSTGALSLGLHTVTATAKGSSGTAQIGNRTINIIAPGKEIGSVDIAEANSSGAVIVAKGALVYVFGWAADTVAGAPVQSVTVFADGNSMGTATLGTARPDVASYYGRSDYTNSGWSFQMSTIALSAGPHSVTAAATGSSGTGPLVGSRTVTVTSLGKEFGSLDVAGNASGAGTVVKGATLYVFGWATDTATGAPVQSVTVFVDGSSVGTATLGIARPDVVNYYIRSDYTNSGWSFQMSTSALSLGQHTVTATAMGPSGTGQLPGTRTVTITTPGQEIGSVDLAGDAGGAGTVAKGATLYVFGWAADTVSGAPVQSVTVLLDGNSAGMATMGAARPDVASFFGRSDYANSGWSFQMSTSVLSTGQHTVTATAMGSSGMAQIGSRTVTISP